MDYTGSTEISFYRDTFMQYKSFMSRDYVLLISGTVEPARDGSRSLISYK